MEKHYKPIPQTLEYIIKKYGRPGSKILEVGPGSTPLQIATHYIDFVDLNLPMLSFIKLNICENKIPFIDGYFDFVYCRHTLEDIHNPEFLFSELKRVAKAGYIETPSPFAELSRGVDGGSPFYRGYIHHRYIIWTTENTLNFLPKYPCIEYTAISDNISNYLKDPWYWNTYLLWDNNCDISHKMHYSELDYKIHTTYNTVLTKSINDSIKNIESTKKQITEYLA